MTVTAEIRSRWQALTPANAQRVEAAVGVYELRSSTGTLRFGYAGAGTRFGLRGELSALAEGAEPDVEFRSEVITTYLSRWSELLGRHLARYGVLPPGNADQHPSPMKPVGPRTAGPR
jgi:hypothetical protein